MHLRYGSWIRVRAVIYTHSLGVDAKEEVYASGSLADVGNKRRGMDGSIIDSENNYPITKKQRDL